MISSRRGELSIMVTAWLIASKAILPLPNLHGELSEETRVRSRYLDLIVREQARVTVRARAAAVRVASSHLRRARLPRGRDPHAAGPARRRLRPPVQSPTPTRSTPSSTCASRRSSSSSAPSVGGIERVFEINRNFRNEGADSTHSPEFAMLEAYQAYGDYNQIADLTQELVQNAAIAVAGSPMVTWADGTEYDLGGEWDRISHVRVAQRGGRRRDHARDADRRPQALAEQGRLEVRPSDRTASSSRSSGSTS